MQPLVLLQTHILVSRYAVFENKTFPLITFEAD